MNIGMATTGDSKINQVTLFSNKPGGMYISPNLKEKDKRIADIRITVSETIKIALFAFLGREVILL